MLYQDKESTIYNQIQKYFLPFYFLMSCDSDFLFRNYFIVEHYHVCGLKASIPIHT